MRDYLTNEGTLDSVQNALVETMREFWKLLDPDLNFTISIGFPSTMSAIDQAALRDDIGRQISTVTTQRTQAFTNRLFFERFDRELDFSRRG
jgi:hypothetical protein